MCSHLEPVAPTNCTNRRNWSAAPTFGRHNDGISDKRRALLQKLSMDTG
jgi:hypothetical protein